LDPAEVKEAIVNVVKEKFQPEQVRTEEGAVRQWTSESKINTTMANNILAVNIVNREVSRKRER
jgi:hypothetical protein